jgi:dienelactone hydrolase
MFTSETVSGGVVERDFRVGEIPGVLWSPVSGPAGAPLVLMGHGGGLHKKAPGQLARARATVTTHGFRVAAIDAPGHGDRPRTAADDRARDDLRQAVASGDIDRFASVTIAYVGSLTQRAVPEWQATLDALQRLPEIGIASPIGYGGGMSMGTAIGIPLTAADSRIRAAVFGGGFFVHDDLIGAARRITVPVQFLLPLDEEYVERQSVLALFDAFASRDKTLLANPGTHRDMRWVGSDPDFLARHLPVPAVR